MESEPNDSLDQANLLTDNLNGSTSYKVLGTITGQYNDVDFFRMDVKQKKIFMSWGNGREISINPARKQI